jgi:hypothetical protein
VSREKGPRCRGRWLAIVLCAACGGLAEDGASALSSAADGEDLHAPLAATPEAITTGTGSRGSEGNAAAILARAAHVGEPCGHLGDESDESVIVGDVELQVDVRCEAGNSCLMHAREGRPCRSSALSSEAECAAETESPFVPVPPPLAPEAEWQGGICTCRCSGSVPGADYCACPRGMQCRALIPSAGVNAAARSYVGSYCAY